MKTAILLVSFGTSHKEASQNSIDAIADALSGSYGAAALYQAYTSSMIIRKLAKEGIEVYNINEALERAHNDKTDVLFVVSTHIIAGHEYNKMLEVIEDFGYKFKHIGIAKPLLYDKSDCANMVTVLDSILDFKAENEYILMGHGTDAEANFMYHNMNAALKAAGFKNVHIATVEASPSLDDAVKEMRPPEEVKSVILHPFMTVAGEHAKNDMTGEKNSFLARLNALGYNTSAILKGLGEYAVFRNIYVEKLKKLTENYL